MEFAKSNDQFNKSHFKGSFHKGLFIKKRVEINS